MGKIKVTKKNINDELNKEISKLMANVRPGWDAQQIRASLSTSFDSALCEHGWLSDHAPGYVWNLIDIAAQWGINHGSLYGARSKVR